jgi:hypothetical protein
MVWLKRVLNGVPMTNNSAESWHSSVSKKFTNAHPNFGKCISIIQNEEEIVIIKLIKSKSGEILTVKREKQLINEARILICLRNFELYEEGEFMNALLKNVGYEFEEDFEIVI